VMAITKMRFCCDFRAPLVAPPALCECCHGGLSGRTTRYNKVTRRLHTSVIQKMASRCRRLRQRAIDARNALARVFNHFDESSELIETEAT